MAYADLLSIPADALPGVLHAAHDFGDSTWDELQRALSQVTSSPESPFGADTVEKRMRDLHDQGYEYGEIVVVAMQQLVHFASPHEISDPFRFAMSSLLVQMRATIDKSLNVR